MRKVSTALALLLALAAWSACNTPTLPIPPPMTEPLTAPDPATGLVSVRVSPDADLERAAFLMVFNRDTQHGVIDARRLDGWFEVEIAASPGDYLTAYWMTGLFEVGQGTSPTEVPAP
jgi:hypothetical protein